MSPRTAQQNQELQDISRKKIIETALLLFAQHGYESTTTRQIAEHAGISYGLMYRYFKNKEELLKVVFQRCIEPLNAMISGLNTSASPENRLIYLIRSTFAIAQADPSLAGLFYTLRSQVAFLNILHDETMQSINGLRTLFADCFREIANPQAELDALMLYAQLEGILRHYLLEPDDFPLNAAIERLIELYALKEN